MTDLVLSDQPTQGVDLEAFARQAVAAAEYAEAVCRTQMVPQAYRGKPEEATAAILAGAELGFGPMASLRAFDPINGTPAPKAITLRAVVTGRGHDIVVEESSATRAIVSGRRRGADTWQTSVWDIDRASKLPQFRTNKNYEHNPAAMLCARATAEVCRWIASDAIMGMPYAAEEIQDERPYEAAPVARRLTAAELTGPPAAQPVDEPTPELVTRDQQKHMFALWNELGFSGDENREQRLTITAKILDAPNIESSNELTADEADRVITALVERRDRVGTV